MSLTNSRWNQPEQEQEPKNNPRNNSKHSKYIPPHSKPKTTNKNIQNNNNNNSIIITNGDRMVSKKFGNQHQQQQDGKLTGFMNSFNLSNPRLDPMSLVPSPSRGIYSSENQTKKSSTPEHDNQDLTNYDFQVEFFKWILNRIQEYKKAYRNRSDLFLYLSLKDSHEDPGKLKNQGEDDEGHYKTQIDRISSLVREIRKLREGIFASGRRDSFAIVVYELSAELALESLDFAQLNTLLNHLIMNLYRTLSISDHLIPASNKQQQEKEDLETLINHHRRTKEEVLNRRLMFARVYLLLPIASRLDISRFIDQFAQITQILSDQTLNNLDHYAHSTAHKLPFSDISGPLHPKLLELETFFKLVLRKNYFQLNQKFIKPKLKKIITARHHQDEDEDESMTTEWDELLFLVFLSSIRINLIWKVIAKSYYHLSLEDDGFIVDLLSLDFQSFYHFRNSSHHPSASSNNLNHHQLVNSWLLKLNIQRNPNGIIQLK
ncbi:hypothetical protein PGT21_004614 [Puccinia graminis f. sp. tritici]|uniref:Uncharacterized protein n=1 Tax=Puccinia graminis f. sp. tritici TaxID=56615 RepID=A0A5B0RS45_PUCGR|nr:hypothetical protein PGT21_004614 [Puccinia graminis f. sp. tritici]KAA1127673.1 hypothetical protein PGTUg99_001704 [Puccinia graminis f. sp. tritici]